MNKLSKYIRQMRFALFVIFQRRHSSKKTNKENNVLLLPSGHMGDVLVEVSAWQCVIEHYQQQGKQIYVLSTKVAWHILQMTIDTRKIYYLEGDNCRPDNGGWSLDITKKLFDELQEIGFDTVIGHLRDKYSQFIVSAIPARKKYIILPRVFCSGIQGQLISGICSEKNTTKIIREPGIPEIEYWEHLLQILSLPNNDLHIMPIPKICEKSTPKAKYVTISIDSLNLRRRWPVGSFVELIRWLLDNYQYDICVTGESMPSDELSQYEQFDKNKRFYNLVNQLSFIDWIELIRGAQFHIGVDSGSIHIAASVGTQAFCLTGFWHGMEFMPYHLREVENTKTPICIYRKDVSSDELNCYGCAAKKNYGYGNAVCLAQCKTGRPCLCLEKITVDDVVSTIEKAKQDRIIN